MRALGGYDANVDGWLGRPAGGYETASGSEPVASEMADVIPGRLIHRSSGGTCRISTPRAHFLPVAHACGDAAGLAPSAMKGERNGPGGTSTRMAVCSGPLDLMQFDALIMYPSARAHAAVTR